ncbi:hypothetical protein P153DRAFT_365124 [Dothidotthia symphoricarpi CBS 119687]|uniref:Ubiquitin-like domain-containing protein n=1 Tax=Dothidotthia symphoricarpi CBS 119687 TaxID=1392245 RepID=A0A6A6AHS7_9PLEO|nr:uncharacterized protein P153DRAFT_365124 [Dothidotthia symphoricarpi CBS 119687]KAF2131542.1 hypothetical protein P153DRAFT_365124 [Dothidotthia symphoricarpi CBS 119687]
MGCGASRPENGSVAPVSVNNVSQSSRSLVARPTPAHSPRASQNALHGRHIEARDRPNHALKPISPVQRSRLPSNTLASPTAKSSLPGSANPSWTRSRLDKERNDWWDTRVTGSQEMWSAIRMAAEHLQKGEIQEAQTILDAAGCTCPSGELWRAVYDSTGIKYKVPEWLVVLPDGLVEEEEGATGPAGSAIPCAYGMGGDEMQEKTEEQGDTALIKIRLSSTQRDVKLRVRKNERVMAIVDQLKQDAQLSPSSRIRLVYLGYLYQEHETLDCPKALWDFGRDDQVLVGLVVSE